MLLRRFDRKLDGEPKIRGVKRKVRIRSSVLCSRGGEGGILTRLILIYSLTPTSGLQMTRGKPRWQLRRNWTGMVQVQRSREERVPAEGTTFSMCAKQFGMSVVGGVPLLWLKGTERPAVRINDISDW